MRMMRMMMPNDSEESHVIGAHTQRLAAIKHIYDDEDNFDDANYHVGDNFDEEEDFNDGEESIGAQTKPMVMKMNMMRGCK